MWETALAVSPPAAVSLKSAFGPAKPVAEHTQRDPLTRPVMIVDTLQNEGS